MNQKSIRSTLIGSLVMLMCGCVSVPVSKDGIEVEFPNVTQESPSFRPAYPDPPKESKEVKIEGTVAYRISGRSKESVKAELFDRIEPGLTLGEIIALLGPGYQPMWAGVGLVHWDCEDGRKLNVWPREGRLSEKPAYWVDVEGVNQKHEVVQKLATELVAGITIDGARVLIVCTKDTVQAKAGKPRFYKVGYKLQKVEPLPRIDFEIKRIESERIFCDYFYQALPDGIVRYTERGNIMLKPKTDKAMESTAHESPEPEDSQPVSPFSSLKLTVGMKRADLEALIARTTGVKSKYNVYTMHKQRQAQYQDGIVILSVKFKPGAPAPWIKTEDGKMEHLPPMDSTVESWEIERK